VFADLVGNTKLAKEYDAMISKRPDRKFAGVVEYCFSGMKFKVRLVDEGRCVAFSLLGVKTMMSDKNQPVFDEYANDALRFAKDHLFQRDVNVEIFNTDKRGNFFGVLTLANKLDFATMLLEEGLAMVNIQGGPK
jgi:staphylococcal nuclease domain-containing protein 1